MFRVSGLGICQLFDSPICRFIFDFSIVQFYMSFDLCICFLFFRVLLIHTDAFGYTEHSCAKHQFQATIRFCLLIPVLVVLAACSCLLFGSFVPPMFKFAFSNLVGGLL
jgi:hypothetical protein